MSGITQQHTGNGGRTRLTVILLALGSAAGLVALVAARGGAPLPTDLAVYELVTAAVTPDGVRLADVLTHLGGGPVLYPVLLAVCAWAAWHRRSAREFLPVLALAAGQVLELVLFATLRRPLPVGDSGLLHTTFSSGHTAAAVLGWGLVAWQLRRTLAASARMRAVWVIALTAGAVVGGTRVYLGLHWLSDAVAGVIAGAVLLAVSIAGISRLASPPTGAGRRAPTPAMVWMKTSRWAWTIPAAAAAFPVALLLATPPGERLKDLLVYHGAGGTAGAGENLYAFRTTFSMPFTYPPFAALLVEPLSRMPWGLAQILWTVATLAAVVALAPVALRPVVDRIGMPLTVTAVLLSTPVRSHLRFGQVGVFLVLLVALDLVHRKPWKGWGLGLAIAVKLTPAVFLPWLLLSRTWKRLGSTLGWLVGATLAGLVLLWPSASDYMFRASRDTTRFGANDIPGNQSVRGMLLRLFGPDNAHTAERLWLITAVVLVALGTYQAWRCERAGNRLAAVGVLAALSVAVSPISWVHHLVWLALPIAALAAAGRWRLVAGWFVVLVVSFPSLGHALGWGLLTNVQGLTAVAAVFFLPRLTCAAGRCDGSCSSRPGPRPCTTPPASGS